MVESIDPLTTISIPIYKHWKETEVKKKDLEDKLYFVEWQTGSLATEQGILFRFEGGKNVHIQQLHMRVMPETLWMDIFLARHVLPMASHSRAMHMMCQLLARYWWSGLRANVNQLIQVCAHCRLTNNVMHKSAGLLIGWDAKSLFGIALLDLWTP
eukprot:3189690-Ditylum_brightwellii.AAC.1